MKKFNGFYFLGTIAIFALLVLSGCDSFFGGGSDGGGWGDWELPSGWTQLTATLPASVSVPVAYTTVAGMDKAVFSFPKTATLYAVFSNDMQSLSATNSGTPVVLGAQVSFGNAAYMSWILRLEGADATSFAAETELIYVGWTKLPVIAPTFWYSAAQVSGAITINNGDTISIKPPDGGSFQYIARGGGDAIPSQADFDNTTGLAVYTSTFTTEAITSSRLISARGKVGASSWGPIQALRISVSGTTTTTTVPASETVTVPVTWVPSGNKPLYIYELASYDYKAATVSTVCEGASPSSVIMKKGKAYKVGAGSRELGWLQDLLFRVGLGGTLSPTSSLDFHRDINEHLQWYCHLDSNGSVVSGL